MKNLIYIITLIASLINLSFAQSSISFGNKKNIDPVLSYRLPAWGYSTFFIDMSGTAHYNSRNIIESNKNKGYLFKSKLNPAFRGYHESEQYIGNYQLSFGFSNRYEHINYTKYNMSNPSTTNRQEDYVSGFNFSGLLQRYIFKNFFFLLNGNTSGDYLNLSIKTTNRADETRAYKHFNIEFKPGIGIGRIRNVTPVLRALRLQERCKALISGLSIGDDEIHKVAQEIAKISGYEVIYQREARYFWQNVLKQAENISTVTPFEVHYLTDILKENIGTRYEGWNIIMGLQTSKPDKAKWILGGFSTANWYKNFSLEHQTHLTLYGTYLKYPDEKYYGEEWVVLGMNINYLWLLTDRIYWNSLLGSRWTSNKGKDNRSIFDNLYKLESSLVFYIENGFNFNINLLLDLSKRKEKYDINPENIITFRSSELTFGFTYYFDRRLF